MVGSLPLCSILSPTQPGARSRRTPQLHGGKAHARSHSREGEAVVLLFEGREIRVTLSEIKGSQARLGFEAPPEVHIVREELQPDPNIVWI